MIQHEEYDVRIDHLRLAEGDAQKIIRDPLTQRHFDQAVLALAQPITTLREAGVPISGRGGVTRAQVYYGDKLVSEATAICSPVDQFNKRIGRLAASGRALHALKKEVTA